MELLLEIHVLELNIGKHNPKLNDYDDLSDYHYCHCDHDLKETAHPPLFYRIKHCEEIFFYLDQLESRLPKSNRSLCWEWTAVRDGRSYYLSLFFETCRDNINEYRNAVNGIFSHNCERIKSFEWPNVEFALDDANNDEHNEGEYDDDSTLRVMDHCTKNSPFIRWNRPSPEKNGEGDSLFSQIADLATILIFVYKCYHFIKFRIAKNYYKRRINRLYHIIRNRYVQKGSIIKPRPAPPKLFNAKTGKGEYVFIHINEKGQERKIIIDISGKNVRTTDFK